MPIWLRTFTYNKVKEFYDKENEENNIQPSNIPPKLIDKPNIQPNYTTKAPSKK